MDFLKGQTALVTGSSRGIGRATALKLAEAGAEIVLHYHRDDVAAQSVARELPRPPRLVKADLRSPGAIETLVASLHELHLDILVNNAGIWGSTPLGSTSLTDAEAMLDLNVMSVFWLTQAVLPLLREGARIVNISSVAGRIGIGTGRSLYGATKAAVDSFTKSWALELAPRKIRVNAVAPGYIATDMTAEHFSNPEVLQHAVDRSPFGRLGEVDEIADAVLFLCSPAARWITGQSINVSGGFVI